MPAATFVQDGPLGIVTLTAPPLNLVSEAFARDLMAAIEQARGADIRALLVQAEGDAFSAGADVSMFEGRTPDTGRALLDEFVPAIRGFEELPYPTVAAVHGLCLAGGFELVLACDLIWAADDSHLGLVEAVIGAIPFGGGIQRLAARCGVARTREAVFGGRMYPAATMLEWGVINRVLPASELHEKARRYAADLATGPTFAHAHTKKVLRIWEEAGLAAADQALPALGGAVMASADVQNGLKSLLEKGPGQAVFEGR